MSTRVLLLSNLDIELGDPFFRAGSYANYLVPLAKALSGDGDFESKFLVAQHIYESLRQKGSALIGAENSIIVDANSERLLGRRMTASYSEISPEAAAESIATIRDLVAEWIPDVILCWEAPTYLFRQAFPAAVVLDLMPSMFARPPYPRAISLDPIGLYEQSWFSCADDAIAAVTDQQVADVEKLRQIFLNHFASMECQRRFSDLLHIPADSKTALVPLQISNYFGFRENCSFVDQYEFIESVAASTTDTIIATQYVGGLISEKALTPRNLQYLNEHVGSVKYSSAFEKVDSISQYILPWVDTVYSVSSTLGLQAKFLGKTLISPGRSHLQFIADGTDLGSSPAPRNVDSIIAAYLHRSILLVDRLITEPSYFANILRDIIDRKRAGMEGSSLLPSPDVVRNDVDTILSYSKMARSVANLKKLFPKVSNIPYYGNVPPEAAISIASEDVRVVSFDIFDTLVRRTVYCPEDVFEIMQRRLPSSGMLPDHAIRRFAELRQAAERLVRQRRDNELLSQAAGGPAEEITIVEVYEEFARILRLPGETVAQLIALEQEVELSVLRPRRVGRAMFDQAISAGKRIVLTSDFIHPPEFIQCVLSQCGYFGFEKLYLSSEQGPKKHSGALFDSLIADLSLPPTRILHIGDNPIGDLRQARAKKLRALMVPSARALLKEALGKRSVTEHALTKSFSLRTFAGLFANTYLYSNHPRRSLGNIGEDAGTFELISNQEEFGFLVLGPLAFAFSDWIINQALADGVHQIVFFARDCHLPFKMCQKIVEERGLANQLKLIYAPTSRKVVSGFDLYVPDDILGVRIDDFTATGTLEKLLSERFLISSDLVDADILEKWGVTTLAAAKRSLTLATIYGIALDVAHRHWDQLSLLYDGRRQRFSEYMQTHTDIDFNAETAAIDFGYQGSIHRKIASLFAKPVLPYFFMTYSDGYGREPIHGAKVYYEENCNPAARANIAVTHNLLLETLMNEGRGSALDIVRLADGTLDVLLDDSVTVEHTQTIQRIHEGAMLLCNEWLAECEPLHRYGLPERDAAMFFFALVAKSPTVTEAKLLSDLVFDNKFAGLESSHIVARSSLWPEGFRVLSAKKKNKAEAPVKVATFTMRMKKSVVRPFVMKLGNQNDIKQFNEDPSSFFAKLKNPTYRKIGTAIFPEAKR